MMDTKEKAIGGVTTGLIRLGETVQWKAKHFGVHFTMTMEITELLRPSHFTDEMIQGPFKQVRHKHIFELTSDGTRMIDLFEFQPPLGILGRIVDALWLKSYMRTLLRKRNQTIKAMAELNNGC